MSSKIIKKMSKSLLSVAICLAMMVTFIVPTLTASATSGNWTGGTVNRGYHLKVAYSESGQDPKTNSSVVKVTLYLVQDSSFSLNIGASRAVTFNVNGATTTITTTPAINNSGGATTQLATWSTTVTHGADGSKSIPITATFAMNATLSGTYYGTMTTSNTVALDKLDRVAPTVSLKYNSATASNVSLTATSNVTCDTWQFSTNGGSTWISYGSVGTSNTFTAYNLSGGQAYSVIVRARKTGNHITAQSSTMSTSTLPLAPGGLTVSDITHATATFKWNAVTGASVGYKIRLNGAFWKDVTTTSYAFVGLGVNTSYTFGVAAIGTSGIGATATTAQFITLPNTPTTLKVTGQVENEVSLSWSQNNAGNAATTVFNIYRDGVLMGTSPTTSYTDTSYINTDSSYSVCAVTSAGSSTESSSVAVTHIPLSMSLTAPSSPAAFSVITPSFIGGLEGVHLDSLKWAYGNQPASYFANEGTGFTTSFAVTQNGIYTVYAEDNGGNSVVQTVTVTNIYTNSSIGAHTVSFTDLSVDSTGIPVEFERIYSSMDASVGPFGKGWSLNYAKSSDASENGLIQTVCLPDGTSEYFTIDGNGNFSGINTQAKLATKSDTLVLTTKDRMTYTYDNSSASTAYLVEISDANGNKLAITLDATTHQPTKITDSANRTYNIAYQDNRITSITDPAGRSVSYVYDASGNLTSQKSTSNVVVNNFEYTDGLLSIVSDAQGKVQSEAVYDEQNRVWMSGDVDETILEYVYSTNTYGETTIAVTQTGTDSETSNVYNAYGQIVLDDSGIMYSYNLDGTVNTLDGANSDQNIVKYFYDSNGNVTEIVTTDMDKKLIEKTAFAYSYFSGTVNISSVKEVSEAFTYDDNGDLPTTETITTILDFDVNGNLKSQNVVDKTGSKTVLYSYYSNGAIKSEIASDKTKTEYLYDIYGSPIDAKVIDTDGLTISIHEIYINNIIGQVISKTSDGITTTAVYDLTGNVIKLTTSDGAESRVMRTVYDDLGKTVQIINDGQYSVLNDGINPDENGICSTNIYNDKTVGYRYTYDDADNILTHINPANNKTINVYDTDSKLVKTVTYPTSSDAENDTNGVVTRYLYDEKGNLVQTIYPHQYVAIKDNLNMASGANEYGDSNIGDRHTYDENDNVIKQIDSLGKETINTYDGNNNVVKSVTNGLVTRLVYGGGDNLLQVISPDQYNEADDNLNLTAEPAVDSYSNANVGDRYTYDDDDNLLTHTNPDGEITTNVYDKNGKLSTVTKPDGTVFTFDKEGNILSETYANGLINSVTTTDKQTIVAGSNGVKTTWNSNNFNEVSEYIFENGTINKKYNYTYYSTGNIKTISLNGALQQTFTYDLSNELTRVDDAVAGKSTTYVYDAVGNITKVSTFAYTTGTLGVALTTEPYSYNSQNQRTDLIYDEKGNLTALGGYSFAWNADGRLTGATSGTSNISYTYNYDNMRTSKTINGVTTQFTLDYMNNVIAQHDGTNSMEFVYDSSNAPIYVVYGGTTYYYEKNLQGDIVGILDEAGTSVVQYEYDEWGVLTSCTGSLASTLGAANPLRYRGYYYDTETELYYLQSRYYSPEMMRFISQDDPYYSNSQGQPLGSNLYAYCLNNPVNFIDRIGMAATPVNVNFFLRSYLSSDKNWNCYGWAIGQQRFVNPGYFSGKKYVLNLQTLKNNAMADLDKLGYYTKEISSLIISKENIRTYNQKLYTIVIALRIGPSDYHWMQRFSKGGVWTHKPGGTAPLKLSVGKYPHDYSKWYCYYHMSATTSASKVNWKYNSRVYYDSAVIYIAFWSKLRGKSYN